MARAATGEEYWLVTATWPGRAGSWQFEMERASVGFVADVTGALREALRMVERDPKLPRVNEATEFAIKLKVRR